MIRYKDSKTENLSKGLKDSIQLSIDENKGLFVFGGTGTGKTYAMHALARGKGKVENFPELLVEYRDYMSRGSYFERIVFLTGQDYLFIDDIGSEKTSDFVIEFLYILVNKRYGNLKRTVFATNLTLDDFRDRYGDRVISRIVEMCVMVDMSGEDRRLS